MTGSVNTADFNVVRTLLSSLQFAETRSDSHVTFNHETTDTVILLPVSVVDSSVSDQDIASIRLRLDSKGLLSSREFDAALVDSVPAQNTKSTRDTGVPVVD